MEQGIPLGSKAKDSVTGLEGTATARCVYLAQTPRVLIETGFDGKRHEEWFDESRLSVVPPQTT